MGFVVNKVALKHFYFEANTRGVCDEQSSIRTLFSRPVHMGFVVNKVALKHFYIKASTRGFCGD